MRLPDEHSIVQKLETIFTHYPGNTLFSQGSHCRHTAPPETPHLNLDKTSSDSFVDK